MYHWVPVVRFPAQAAGKHRDPQVFSGTLAAKQDCRQLFFLVRDEPQVQHADVGMQLGCYIATFVLLLLLLLWLCVCVSNSHPHLHSVMMLDLLDGLGICRSQSHPIPIGKELQKQLSQRVLNEDLRAFLELIQRVQAIKSGGYPGLS
jgi:hypothetical protein